VILLDPHSFEPDPAPSGEAAAFVAFLASLGIPAQRIGRGDIQPYSASYGELSRWEFQTLGTGRAFARHSPRPRLDGPRPGPEALR
jgi:hypothetical protein